MNYKIFQIHDDANNKMFQCLDRIGGVNAVAPIDYVCIYEGEIEGDVSEALEKLWVIFNTQHPEDYCGRSLSVSDVVMLNDVAYFCDSFGWTEIPGFFKAYQDASPEVWKYRIKKAASLNARSIACKLCDEDCYAGYECNKEHRVAFDLMGKGTVCPLAKYKVPKITTPRTFADTFVTLEDLSILCANCEHADIEAEDGDFVLSLDRCFDTHCIDCPVQSMREGIQENAAEAAMS